MRRAWVAPDAESTLVIYPLASPIRILFAEYAGDPSAICFVRFLQTQGSAPPLPFYAGGSPSAPSRSRRIASTSHHSGPLNSPADSIGPSAKAAVKSISPPIPPEPSDANNSWARSETRRHASSSKLASSVWRRQPAREFQGFFWRQLSIHGGLA